LCPFDVKAICCAQDTILLMPATLLLEIKYFPTILAKIKQATGAKRAIFYKIYISHPHSFSLSIAASQMLPKWCMKEDRWIKKIARRVGECKQILPLEKPCLLTFLLGDNTH
jgi:hypothetical protein